MVSVIGCFSESAEAGLFRGSGSSDPKRGSETSVDVVFYLDTDKGIVENFTAIESIGKDASREPFLDVSSPIGNVEPSDFTSSDLNTLKEQLREVGGDDNDLGFITDNVVKYDLTFADDSELSNYKGTLYIPGLDASLAALDNIFASNNIETAEIPGILIRDFVKELDGENQKIIINGVESTIDLFGVGGSNPFNVKKVNKQNIPEPATAAGLLAVLAVGGLSLRKGDRSIKSKTIIKN